MRKKEAKKRSLLSMDLDCKQLYCHHTGAIDVYVGILVKVTLSRSNQSIVQPQYPY